MNAIFVANKPMFISSNNYMSRLKRKYKVKKAGFSGTLDPFANGSLIVAFGSYTRLFQYLDKSPKTYIATIWIGVESKSFDIENVVSISDIPKFKKELLESALLDLKGKIEYTPPKFSAKRIDGKRAYELAREDKEVKLKKIETEIFDIKVLNYSHPFLTFEVSLSEGGYVRSIAEILSKKFNIPMTLSFLKRVSEGKFKFENEKFLNPIEILNLQQNFYLGEPQDLIDGKKLTRENFKISENGTYLVRYQKYFSIIEINENENIKYLLNRMEIC